jgi:hypothetical protein
MLMIGLEDAAESGPKLLGVFRNAPATHPKRLDLRITKPTWLRWPRPASTRRSAWKSLHHPDFRLYFMGSRNCGRRMLIAIQVASAGVAALLAVLEARNSLTEGRLSAGALVLGMLFTFALPVRAAMFPRLVSDHGATWKRRGR